jgi:hypothetical protein
MSTKFRRGVKPHENFSSFNKLWHRLYKGLGFNRAPLPPKTKAKEYIVRATKSLEKPRRLLIQTILMAPTACDRVRVLEPDRLSATIPGVRTVSGVKSADYNAPLPGEEKVFIWQRTIMDYPGFLPKLRELLRRDYLIIAEIDDDPLRRPEYGKIDFSVTEVVMGYKPLRNPWENTCDNIIPMWQSFRINWLICPTAHLLTRPTR